MPRTDGKDEQELLASEAGEEALEDLQGAAPAGADRTVVFAKRAAATAAVLLLCAGLASVALGLASRRAAGRAAAPPAAKNGVAQLWGSMPVGQSMPTSRAYPSDNRVVMSHSVLSAPGPVVSPTDGSYYVPSESPTEDDPVPAVSPTDDYVPVPVAIPTEYDPVPASAYHGDAYHGSNYAVQQQQLQYSSYNPSSYGILTADNYDTAWIWWVVLCLLLLTLAVYGLYLFCRK